MTLGLFLKKLLPSSDNKCSRGLRFEDYNNNSARIALIWYVHAIFKPMIRTVYICAWRKRLNSWRHCHWCLFVGFLSVVFKCYWFWFCVTHSVMYGYSVESQTRRKHSFTKATQMLLRSDPFLIFRCWQLLTGTGQETCYAKNRLLKCRFQDTKAYLMAGKSETN